MPYSTRVVLCLALLLASGSTVAMAEEPPKRLIGASPAFSKADLDSLLWLAKTNREKAKKQLQERGVTLFQDKQGKIRRISFLDSQATAEDFKLVREFPYLEDLNCRTSASDEELVHLRGMKNVRVVGLSFSKISDASLKHLATLPRLQNLQLSNTQITDEGIRHLLALKEVTTLQLSSTKISDAGCQAIMQSFPDLEMLGVNLCKLSDESLRHVQDARSLATLHIYGAQLTDQGLAHLREHPRLDWLNLGFTKISDEGLAHLETLPRLRTLGLENTKITDTGLETIGEIKTLKYVWLPEGISPQAREKLTARLPKLRKIFY